MFTGNFLWIGLGIRTAQMNNEGRDCFFNEQASRTENRLCYYRFTENHFLIWDMNNEKTFTVFSSSTELTLRF